MGNLINKIGLPSKQLLVLISAIQLVTLSVPAEEYLSDPTLGTPTHEVTEDVSSENVAACRTAENHFQDFVVGNIDTAVSAFSDSFTCITGGVISPSQGNCEELNQSNLNMLKEYRAGLDQVFQELMEHYVQNHQLPEFARGCIFHESASGNIRGPTSLAMEMPECQPIAAGYFANLDFRVTDLLNGEIPSSIPAEQRQQMLAYRQSAIARTLPDNIKYTRDLSDTELSQALGVSFNGLRTRVSQFRERMNNLSDTNLFQLYEFENQFERFVGYQTEEIQTVFRECRQNSRFYNTCRPGAEGADLSRCGAQAWDFTSEFLPLIPAIDGIAGLGDLRAARDAGVMTSDEYVAGATENVMKVMFGFGGITGIVRTGARRVASLGTARSMADDVANAGRVRPGTPYPALPPSGPRVNALEEFTARTGTPVEVRAILTPNGPFEAIVDTATGRPLFFWKRRISSYGGEAAFDRIEANVSLQPGARIDVPESLVYDPNLQGQGFYSYMFNRMVREAPDVRQTIVSGLESDNLARLRQLVEQGYSPIEAFRGTPAYRVRIQNGFTEIIEDSVRILRDRDGNFVNIELVMRRP